MHVDLAGYRLVADAGRVAATPIRLHHIYEFPGQDLDAACADAPEWPYVAALWRAARFPYPKPGVVYPDELSIYLFRPCHYI